MKIELKWKLTLAIVFYGITILGISGLIMEILIDKATTEIVLALVPIVSAMALIYGTYFGKTLMDMRPIIEMTDAANKVNNGNLNVSVKKEGNDEIGDLAKAFNQMFLSIRKMAGDLGEDVGTDTPDIVQAVAIKGTQKIGLKWKLTLVMAFYGITMLMIGWLMVENISGMDTVQIILTMFPIITIGALIFGIYFGKKLVDVRPIVEMAEAARKVKNGDLNVSVKEDGNDEIADLAKAFNQMILSVRFVVGSMDEKESMS